MKATLLAPGALVIFLSAGLAATAAGPPRSETLIDAAGRFHAASVLATERGNAVRYQLAGEERTLRVTEARVTHLDVGFDAAAETIFVAWDEQTDEGITPWFTLSQNGGESFWEAQTIKYDVPIRYQPIDPHVTEVSVPAVLQAPRSRLYLVQFKTVAVDAWREGIQAAGAEILKSHPRHSYIVRADVGAMAAVRQLPYVRWTGAYHPAYRMEPAISAAIEAGQPLAHRRYNLLAFGNGADFQYPLAAEVSALGGVVVSPWEDDRGSLMEVELSWDQVILLSRSDLVMWIDRWFPPENDMNRARNFHGAFALENATGYSGTGISGEVLDGGTMVAHQDFDGIQTHPNTNVANGDHGTCTYGIVFGNGDRDGDGVATATGMMPSGTGWAAFYGDLNGSRFNHSQDLVNPPMNCLFQSNSWGGGRTGIYNAQSNEMDNIIFNLDILILNSMSNGSFNTAVRPQAWAKNVVSVGGINHKDTVTASDDEWGGGCEPANCASQGPAEDGSIKPDLASFYDLVYTTDRYPGGYSGNEYTFAFNGTSAATPIVAGAFGLMYEMWSENEFGTNPTGSTPFEKRPHAMTARALMTNQAFRYTIGNTNRGEALRIQQGWGMPDLNNLLANASRINVIDESSVLAVGETDSYCISIPSGTPDLMITMNYLDPPGTTSSSLHRINDVSITVMDPNGTTYYGNVGLETDNYSTSGGAKDDLNVAEHVFIQNPMAGDWNIVVSADEVNEDGHIETGAMDVDYALVVTGVACPGLNCCGGPPPAYNVDIVTGPGPGSANSPNVKGFDTDGTGNGFTDFVAYGAGGYGVNVAMANYRNTVAPVADLLTGPGPGDVYGPQIRGFARDGSPVSKINFYAYGTLKFGSNVDGADVDCDGYSEILSAAGPGAVFGPHIRGWNFDASSFTAIQKVNFFAFSTLRYGAVVTGGDVDADMCDEILVGAGAGAVFAAQIRGFDYDNGTLSGISKINFNAYTTRYGAHPAAGDVDGDAIDEILASPGPDPAAAANVRGYNYDGASLAGISAINFTSGSAMYGATIDTADIEDDTYAELIVGTGYDPAASSNLKGYEYDAASINAIGVLDFNAYTGTTYGVNVAVDEVGP